MFTAFVGWSFEGRTEGFRIFEGFWAIMEPILTICTALGTWACWWYIWSTTVFPITGLVNWSASYPYLAGTYFCEQNFCLSWKANIQSTLEMPPLCLQKKQWQLHKGIGKHEQVVYRVGDYFCDLLDHTHAGVCALLGRRRRLL